MTVQLDWPPDVVDRLTEDARQRGLSLDDYLLQTVLRPKEEYLEQRNGGYYIKDARVSLESVVCAFLRGESPEGIAESFPVLRLDQIFGALAFYVANREKVDRYLSEGRREFESLRQQARRNNPALYAKLAEARKRTPMPGA